MVVVVGSWREKMRREPPLAALEALRAPAYVGPARATTVCRSKALCITSARRAGSASRSVFALALVGPLIAADHSGNLRR